MHSYLNLLRTVLETGSRKTDRTGTGTLSVLGPQLRFDLSKGFPILTTKKIHWKSVVHELLWFLDGDTNVGYLQEHGVKIWDEWADSNGDLGPIYGYQWRHLKDVNGYRIDQITNAMNLLKRDPDSRRNVVSAWNVQHIPLMRLAPCHAMLQLYVADGKLSLHLSQRSADVLLGIPFNLAGYALLTHMFAQQANLEVGELVWTGGDVHLYLNHLEQAKEQLSRSPTVLPKLELERAPSIFDYRYEYCRLEGYNPQPAIKAPVAV